MEPFKESGKNDTVIIIAICGGSGSGKTTLARDLIQRIGEKNCCLLAQDSYYIDQSHRFVEDGGEVNFDHPSSLDFPLMMAHLQALKSQSSIDIPIYDFASHKRLHQTLTMSPKPIVIVDGTLILNEPCIREIVNLSLFLDIPEEVRFSRRMIRDVKERGRKPEGVRQQFVKQVKPMHDLYVQPSCQWAQWIIKDNLCAGTCLDQVMESLDRHFGGTFRKS